MPVITSSARDIGHAITSLSLSLAREKSAAVPEISGLRGKLYLSKSGWVLLSVPNALARGAFDALGESGIELPPGSGDGPFNAHISVMRPEELAAAGIAPEKIAERGHEFSYTLGPVRSTVPAGWSEMSRVWFIGIHSTELERLRKSYGLSALPNEGKFKFHCTFAVRRKGVGRAGGAMKRSFVHEIFSFDKPTAGTATELAATEPAATEPVSAAEALRQEKQARAHRALKKLLEAHHASKRKDYGRKHDILRELMSRHAQDWKIDQPDRAYPGIVHTPTGFKFHMPRHAIPPDVKEALCL